MNKKTRNAIAASVSAIALICAAEAADSNAEFAAADNSVAIEWNIPAQPLTDALIAWSEQSNYVVLIEDDLTAGIRSPALTGSFTRFEALERLLAASGLTYKTRDEDPHEAVEVTRDPSGMAPCLLARQHSAIWLFSDLEIAIAAGLAVPAIDWTALARFLAYAASQNWDQSLIEYIARQTNENGVSIGVGGAASLLTSPNTRDQKTVLRWTNDFVETRIDEIMETVGPSGGHVPQSAIVRPAVDSADAVREHFETGRERLGFSTSGVRIDERAEEIRAKHQEQSISAVGQIGDGASHADKGKEVEAVVEDKIHDDALEKEYEKLQRRQERRLPSGAARRKASRERPRDD